MICRKCPRCGGEWFSADTGPWSCEYCGARLDDRHNKDAEGGESMRKLIFAFIGKKAELKAHLALAAARETGTSNVVYLQRCELCGRLSAGDICRKCEPMFRKWSKKIATEMAAEIKPTDPIIA